MLLSKRILGLLAVWLFVVGSCTDEVNPPEILAIDQSYFPVALGNFRIYNATETIYFTPVDVQTRQFQIKEQIERKFINQQGQESFEVFRYSRVNASQNWALDSLFVIRKENIRAIQTENNIPFIKMVFPITQGREWDGNGLNGRPSERYFYKEILPSYNPGTTNFSDCVLVEQQDDDDRLTIRDIRYEVYAKNIGMVHRYSEVLRYCSRPECLGQRVVERGVFIEMKLVEYGVN